MKRERFTVRRTEALGYRLMQSRLYAVRALLGCIRPMDEGRQAETLTGVVEAEGSLVYAKMTDETTGWELGAPVASGFPMSGFGNASFTSRFLARVLVVAGRDSENRLTNANMVYRRRFDMEQTDG